MAALHSQAEGMVESLHTIFGEHTCQISKQVMLRLQKQVHVHLHLGRCPRLKFAGPASLLLLE